MVERGPIERALGRGVEAIDRWARRTFGRGFVAPLELLDPDGEGIYLYDVLWEGDGPSYPGTLNRAALILYGDMREWRNVVTESVWMRPGDDDLWYPAATGKHPRHWRLNLPPRWRPVAYVYCTPKPDAASAALPPKRA